jgi:tRNA uridine 5-carboxymethylaminomethyl modification enzyme
LNAARYALDRSPVVLGRESSYIGVLVDDLVSRGVDEPYRLFTSRSEFRLTVRQDNALQRLAPVAVEAGLLLDGERRRVDARLAAGARTLALARSTTLRPDAANAVLDAAGSAPISQPATIGDLARRQGVDLGLLLRAGGITGDLDRDVITTVDLELKYAGYFERERVQAEKLTRLGGFVLPPNAPYLELKSLSVEARQKLHERRPGTLAQAASIPGVSPSDLQNLVIEVERLRRVAEGVVRAS